MFIQKAELRKFRDISFLAESILRNIPHMKNIGMRFGMISLECPGVGDGEKSKKY